MNKLKPIILEVLRANSNRISHGSAGLTIRKLEEAFKLLINLGANEDINSFILYTERMGLQDLLHHRFEFKLFRNWLWDNLTIKRVHGMPPIQEDITYQAILMTKDEKNIVIIEYQ